MDPSKASSSSLEKQKSDANFLLQIRLGSPWMEINHLGIESQNTKTMDEHRYIQ